MDHVVAGFWRRLAALFGDGLLLAIGGMLAGWALFDWFAAMGGWARFLGFAVALTYFGVLNSRIGNGQTLGKRLLRVRAVGVDGELLSLPRSLARYCVLGLPFFLNNAPFGPRVLDTWLAYPLAAIVFGGMVSIAYLYVFNRRTRQSLHDLAVRSFVVPAAHDQGAPAQRTVWRGHLVVVGAILLVALLAPWIVRQFVPADTFGQLTRLHQTMVEEPGVLHVEASINFEGTDAGLRKRDVAISVALSSPRIDDEQLAERLAREVAASPLAEDAPEIVVRLRHGFDMGFASAWRSAKYRFGTLQLEDDAP